MDNLIQCVQENKNKFPQDLYIVVLTKAEKLMPNVLRNQFFARLSCPTPDYDQSVYRYRFVDECIEYLWTIPSQNACHHLLNNAHLVVKEEQDLLNFVRLFADGSLFALAKNLNKEHAEDPVMFINTKVSQ